jgi:hypothetical protein
MLRAHICIWRYVYSCWFYLSQRDAQNNVFMNWFWSKPVTECDSIETSDRDEKSLAECEHFKVKFRGLSDYTGWQDLYVNLFLAAIVSGMLIFFEPCLDNTLLCSLQLRFRVLYFLLLLFSSAPDFWRAVVRYHSFTLHVAYVVFVFLRSVGSGFKFVGEMRKACNSSYYMSLLLIIS